MDLLIPYIYQTHDQDPAFKEFTYGDVGQRARKLKEKVKKGEYIFFHMSKGGKKYITAYFVVDRVLDTVVACQDKTISDNYENHHIRHMREHMEKKRALPEDDVVVFGDPITSRILDKPLLFGRGLAQKLSLNIKFPTTKRSETQVIGSATRNWRQLTNEDVEMLLNEIRATKDSLYLPSLRSTEEVAETNEKDVEDYIANNPQLIGIGLRFEKQQKVIEEGRTDLHFRDDEGNLVVVEVKLNRIGRDALNQIRRYVKGLRKKEIGKKVSGVIVCSGVMPVYENVLRNQNDIRILTYGWELKMQKWE